MPLPSNNSAWPLPGHSKALQHMAEWSVWYAGDPTELASYYARNAQRQTQARTRPAQHGDGMLGRVARWWWGTPTAPGEQPAKLHVPLAADICATSADLLFSESIKLTADGNLQEALDTLQYRGLDAQLHEAAEVQAALGGVYLRVMWDETVATLPWSDAVHPDMALPEFRAGRLSAVTFWQRLHSTDERVVWRLLERHEPGRILYGLYAGTDDKLGTQHPLEDHPVSADLAAIVDEEGGHPTGTNRLTATYIPNMLPNRLDRGSHQGRSDLQGVTPWLDALDEAYSSWWRDIRHAKSRLHIPASMLESGGPGSAALTNTDREVYVPLEGVMHKAGDPLSNSIQAQQFAIRVADHKDTCEFWTQKIIEASGYSTQSLSSDTGGAMTATEVRAHQSRSFTTRGKKIRYWKAAILEHLQTVVEVANANLSAAITPGDIAVDFPSGVQDSQLVLAQTAQALKNAEAASTKTRVQLINPDWDDQAVDAEVELIHGEAALAAPESPLPGDAGL